MVMRFLAWVMVVVLTLQCGQLSPAARAQTYDGPNQPQPKRTVPVAPVTPQPSHGHPADTRSGSQPCEYGDRRCGSNPTTPAPHEDDHTGRNVAIGVGAGALAGLVIYKVATHKAEHVKTLDEKGPQFPEVLHMSKFQVTGFVKGGWPIVLDYEAQPGTNAVVIVSPEGSAPFRAILPTQATGRQQVRIQAPPNIGTELKIADFTIVSTVSPTDPRLAYFRVYGFGCGPRAIGSVAIDELRFSPAIVTASNSDTHFGFHAHTSFDRVRAEFMQLQFIDNCMENKQFDDKSINRRLQENESVEDTWNAKKSHPGQIQFRVRGWMTKDNGGDWVSAFSPDLVLRQ